MMIETKHLVLRNWQESDAVTLYQVVIEGRYPVLSSGNDFVVQPAENCATAPEGTPTEE